MIFDLNQPVDIYCERTDPSFWAEPVNALSNIAFILAGYFILSLYLNQCKDRGENTRKDFWILLLIGLIFTVGIGSFIFHTFATTWALLVDNVPIVVFSLIYLTVASKRALKWSYQKSGIALAIFMVIYLIFNILVPNEVLNHSALYIPYFIVLLIFALILTHRKDPNAKTFWIGFGLFTSALLVRYIDMTICPCFPLGTHFLWHIFNGMMMYFLIKVLVDIEGQKAKK